jgi:hypothetical protein
MITFKKTKDPDNPKYDHTNVIVTCDSPTLTDVCDAFADFLRGAGYGYVKELEVITDYEVKSDEPNLLD